LIPLGWPVKLSGVLNISPHWTGIYDGLAEQAKCSMPRFA